MLDIHIDADARPVQGEAHKVAGPRAFSAKDHPAFPRARDRLIHQIRKQGR